MGRNLSNISRKSDCIAFVLSTNYSLFIFVMQNLFIEENMLRSMWEEREKFAQERTQAFPDLK